MHHPNFQVFILKASTAYKAKNGGGSISGANEVDLLADHAFAMFDTDTRAMLATSASAGDYDDTTRFHWVQGRLTNVPSGNILPFPSHVFEKSTTKVIKKNYVAPVKKNIKVGYNSGTSTGSLYLPATLIVGSILRMKVYRDYNVNNGSALGYNEFNTRPRIDAIDVEIYVKASDTQDTIVASAVAAINAHPKNQGTDKFVTASVLGTYAGSNLAINLAGQINNQDFNVTVDELIIDATVTTTTALVFGFGTSDQVAEMESYSRINQGDSNRYVQPALFFNVPSHVVSGATYTAYEIKCQAKSDAVTQYAPSQELQAIIYVPDADTQETNLDALFAALGITVIDGD